MLKSTLPVVRAALVPITLLVNSHFVSATDVTTAPALAVASALGQNAPRTAADSRREVASLMQRARKAMSEADWDTAETLVSQAEALHVQFGKLHMGDTPAKVRRDLDRQRPADHVPSSASLARKVDATSQIPPAKQALTSAPSGAMPATAGGPPPLGQNISVEGQRPAAATRGEMPTEFAFPPAGRQPNTAENPFELAEQRGSLPTAQRMPTPAPRGAAPRRIDEMPAEATPPGERMAATPARPTGSENDVRAQSDRLLVGARKALAVGDAGQASRLAAQAQALSARYEMHDDNPNKVAGAIQKYAELQQLAGNKESEAYRRKYVESLMQQAEALLAWKQFEDAERLANDAQRVRISYGPFDAKPEELLSRVATARRRSGHFADSAVAPAGYEAAIPQEQPTAIPGDQPPASGQPMAPPQGARGPAANLAQQPPGQRAVYNPGRDTTQNIQVAGSSALPQASQDELFRLPSESSVSTLRVSGETTPTGSGDEETVPAPVTPERALPARPTTAPGNSAGSLLNRTAEDQQILARKIAADLAAQYSEAKRLQETDPKRALEVLQQARAMVDKSSLDQGRRDQLLRSADRRITEMQQYIETNRPKIELKERNQAVKDEIDREQQVKLDVQNKLAQLVDEFNKLMEEQRYPEAEVLAKKAEELAPNEPVVKQLRMQSTFVRRLANVNRIQAGKEDGFVTALNNAEESAIPFDDNQPFQFNKDAREWEQLTATRAKMKHDGRARRSEKEIEIEKSLKTPVSLKFQDTPLADVMDHLKTLAGVNIHLDPRGLSAEGMTADTPVTIDISQPISLKSALNLILDPLHLSYVIKNEVLNITSEQLRDNHVYPVTYDVADLVIPIPNFTPDSNLGLTGALNAAQASARAGMVGSIFSGDAPLAVASNSGANTNAVLDPRVMAQMAGTSGPIAGLNPSIGNGPGGLAGGAAADFDSLIDLIVQTINPESWDANGGAGSITRFPNNLSLVISQKQDVHEEIADLLAQLRRLQDLQVTIEVRFITLNDNFFERIGVDFNFQLQDYAPASLVGSANVGTLNQGGALSSYDPQLSQRTSATVGLGSSGVGNFTDTLNIPFTQDSYSSAIPQFGGYAAGSGATLGFAILSDIEAYFFIEAAQGDRRSNVLQAPKVTLFNGQQAFVSDTSQSPFVISVIPVVGDFAAAQQPVIVVLSEGTMLTVQAVVSEDRRFVRLTIVPFFSSIGAVNTFTFTGSSSSTSNSNSQGPTDNTTGRSNATTTTTEGTTVQLPTFSFVSVSTTVSVPDGGTVLLGGVKRLSEGRNEFGVPILNKLPYVNRLFQNTAIGRQTESLMMMVTPRIIIQEEEEFNLTGQNPPAP